MKALETRDPFLADYKHNLRDIIRGMKNIGQSGLQLLVQEMIRSRWIRDRRASYPHEVAWVFDKKEEAVSKILKRLEESRDIEPADLGRGKKGLEKPFQGALQTPYVPESAKIVGETSLRSWPKLVEKSRWIQFQLLRHDHEVCITWCLGV